MKVDKYIYNNVKRLHKLGGSSIKQTVKNSGLSRSTVDRILKSKNYDHYHELSHKDVPSFYGYETNKKEFTLLYILATIAVLVAFAIVIFNIAQNK